MEKRRRCNLCNTDVHRASLGKFSKSRKHSENERRFPSHFFDEKNYPESKKVKS